MPALTEYLRMNYSDAYIALTNYVYRASDKIELIIKNNGSPIAHGYWPLLMTTTVSTTAALLMQYNGYGSRKVINVSHNGTWSGDNAVFFESPYDYTNIYKIVLDGSDFSIYKGPDLDSLTTLAASASIGTSNDTDTVYLTLFAHNSINPGHCTDANFYSFRVWRNNTLIHEYLPSVDCVYDTITDTIIDITGSGYINGPAIAEKYTVVFDANGGSGTMPDQEIEIDVPTALSSNLFSRAGYVFTGWADTPNGAVHYTDGAVVTNLGEPDETVTLYAVWRTGFSIDIQVNYTEPEALDKDVNTIMTLSGTLKSETSLINPVIIIHADLSSVANANYMTIPAFGRKYFITNIRSIRTGLIEISAHVDVLSTYADGIRANTGITRRQANEWNLYLNDGSLRMYQDQMIQTKKFPGGFDTMEFVLAVAGSSS